MIDIGDFVWVPACIDPGLFSNEKSASIVDVRTGEDVNLFVMNAIARDAHVMGTVMDTDNNLALVRIKSQCGSHDVTVRKSELWPVS